LLAAVLYQQQHQQQHQQPRRVASKLELSDIYLLPYLDTTLVFVIVVFV
jgi:hypothetical protein